jgi:hypothetical protein
MLEHHADVSPFAADVARGKLIDFVSALPVPDEFTIDVQPATVDALQVVDTAQERRLARS